MASSEARSWRRSLAGRYAMTLAAVALGSTLLVGAPLYVLAVRLLVETLDDQVEGIAELAARFAPDQAALSVIQDEGDLAAIFLVDPQGKVVMTWGAPQGTVTLTDADRAAIAEARTSDSSHSRLLRDRDGDAYLDAFAPAASGGGVVGVRASAPYQEQLDALRALFGLAALAWAAAVSVLGALAGRRLGRPIQRLLAAAGRLAGGEAPATLDQTGIDELDGLQRAFSEMATAVHQRETRLRALAGAVAHEVRNPSHALRLHLGLLRRDLGDGAGRVASRLDTLESELDHLDATLEGFLLFSRARAAHRAPVDLRTMLERAADGAEVDAPAVQVDVDPLLVGRAVSNLVRNAREIGGEPVRIVATVGTRLRIAVHDAGPGFSTLVRERAFEPFVSTRPEGAGLGLAIVGSIARAHGGDARIETSEPGHTVVVLDVPMSPVD